MKDAVFTSDEDFERIVSFYFDEKLSKLHEEELQLLKRWRFGVDILKKYPTTLKAAKHLCKMFSEISLEQAEFDIEKSKKLFSRLNKYDKSFLSFFLIESLITEIPKNKSKTVRNKNLSTLKKVLTQYPKYLEERNISIDEFISDVEGRLKN